MRALLTSTGHLRELVRKSVHLSQKSKQLRPPRTTNGRKWSAQNVFIGSFLWSLELWRYWCNYRVERISRVWNWFSSGKVTLHFLATKKLPFWKENIEQTRKALRFLPIWRKKMHSFLDLLGDTFQLASFVWCTLLLWANVFGRHLNDQLSKISNFWWKYEFFAFNPWFCNCDQTCVKIEVSWCLLQPFWFKSVLCTGGRYRLCLGLVREYKNSICS